MRLPLISTNPESMSAADLLEQGLENEATADQPTEPEVVITDYHPGLIEALREAWQSRRLLFILGSTIAWRMIKRYRLGPVWIVFQTFMAVIGYSLIFGGGVFNVKTPHDMPYFLFLLVGMMGWRLFMTILNFSTRAFLRARMFVRDLHIPIVLIPIAGSAQAFIQFVLYLIAYVLVIVYYWVAKGEFYAQLEPKYLGMSLLGLSLCMLFGLGIGFWTSTLTAWARDFRIIIKYLMPFWMFVTPVLYPISKLHGKTRTIAELNPIASAVEMAKVGLLGAGSVRVWAGVWSIAAVTVVFFSGVWFVSRFGHTLAGLRKDLEEEDEEMM